MSTSCAVNNGAKANCVWNLHKWSVNCTVNWKAKYNFYSGKIKSTANEFSKTYFNINVILFFY